jgi:alpha-1,3-rhamnosyl/mannosyltransferase
MAGAERYVLALGTVEPRKDLPSLLAAFDAAAARLPDVRLVVAGPDGWGQPAFDDALARTVHRDRVVRVGWVEDPVRAALLSGAWAYAYPSLYEGFGFPPLEAMAVGVPVVATTAGALPEVLGDAARLVPPGDTDALAEALVALDDDAERAALVERGRRRVGRFSWDACADGLTALYRRAVGG